MIKKSTNNKDKLLDFEIDISYGQIIANKIYDFINSTKPHIRIKDTRNYFRLKVFLRQMVKKIIVLLPSKITLKVINQIRNRK